MRILLDGQPIVPLTFLNPAHTHPPSDGQLALGQQDANCPRPVRWEHDDLRAHGVTSSSPLHQQHHAARA
jgi:hypothetical protein